MTDDGRGRDSCRLLCADVGGSFVDLALVDDFGAISHREKHPTPKDDWNRFVEVFADALRRHAEVVGPGPLAIATAGLVDPDTGLLISANVPCASGRQMADELAAALRHPVVLVNDAHAFALAEATLGLAREHGRVFGIILGTGVGGGLVEDGQLLTGSGGVVGEWGHGQAVPALPSCREAMPLFRCGCGRWGCLDTVGGARGLKRLHRHLHSLEKKSVAILVEWCDGLPEASATVDLYCDLVSGLLSIVLNTYPATIVPVGGGLSGSRPLITELDRRVRTRMLRPTTGPLLVSTALGGDAGLLGAFICAGGGASMRNIRRPPFTTSKLAGA